tara:strand:- start:547 stop:963 length:417 start_codon:yes stop_codon:yes gene_type:complete
MEKSCGVILFNEQEILLLQHSDKKKQGHWDFPKGHVEDGETELQTALRELAEETGITDVEVFPDFNHTISYHIMKEGRRVFKEVTFFIGITIKKKISISDEHQAFAWLDYDSAIKRLTYDTAKETLAKSFNFYQKKRI